MPADAKKLYYRIELRFIPCGSATPVMTQLVKSPFRQLHGCDKLYSVVESTMATKVAPQIGSSEEQLASFIDKFDPKHAALIRSVRKALRKRLPTANELVYDNYNFFVIGYCSTERPSDCVVSIAAGANGVGLSFYYGASLPDPHKLLLGSGSQNRFIRLESVATLENLGVEDLIAAAIAQAESPLPARGKGKLVIRSISKKQKPRRKPTD